MIEIPYEMLVTSEMMNTQIAFCENVNKAFDATAATEGLLDPQLRSVLGASMQYIAASSVNRLRRAIKAFINDLKNFITTQFTKMMIRIGVDDEYCIDRNNVGEFLMHNWDRIIDIQRTINSELRLLKRGSMMKINYEKRSNLNTKIRVVAADFERWKNHTEAKKVEVRKVKQTVARFKDMIHELSLGVKDLELIEARLNTMIDMPDTIQSNINQLLQIMTYSITVYATLVNSLEGSIEPMTRIVNAIVNAPKALKPYDDDVDIKAVRSAN